jgi:hypothetical protein
MTAPGRYAIAALVTLSSSCVPIAGAATLARQPTLNERQAITQALPSRFRKDPIGCVWLETTVSNNGQYAIAAPQFLNALHMPCLKYASNGWWILRKVGRWKIIFNGSVDPPCSLGVPRDLSLCAKGR